MLTQSLRVKLETVRKLIRRNARHPLENLLTKLHPADIASIYKNLTELEREKIWNYISDQSIIASAVLELEDSDIIHFFENRPLKEIAPIIEEMESDDAAEIVRLLPDDMTGELLKMIGKDEMSEVETLLTFAEDTAGAIMNTSFFALQEDMTVKEATKTLHKAEDVEMVFYLYIIDSEGKLSGVLSLRQLILNTPDKKLSDIMSREVINVNTDVDQEDVAKMVERYDLLALPVVDENYKLVGIITVDDVIDIIREEATEDIYRMAGTSDGELLFGHNSAKVARVRLPWLLITFAGSMVSGLVVAFFQGKVTQFALLVPFMPVIMAMAGNVGSQSATILIRGVALGKINPSDIARVTFKEMRVGAIIGLTCGLLLSGVSYFVDGSAILGLSVGVSMFFSLSIAAFTGAFVPATLIKLNFDPAVASSPFISMLNDILGLSVYFGTAVMFFRYLG
ncbi:magnesium transporter [Denitrovibrio acetiphilus DSM 12809]|uniref:Magnesium transporter MgtE n=1 Tax=Denitrovibrio acetiphilus (strain DSM 12809 / NBRC 114555 / N2460) TaxID=522772 RepID=D4H8E4_DENA2|nr:magnesium transporter [Denitrovibrio acetiphilus]ADD68293.1 magnesium transporter [Denitrovibrio acetiphilus DSM 12809]